MSSSSFSGSAACVSAAGLVQELPPCLFVSRNFSSKTLQEVNRGNCPCIHVQTSTNKPKKCECPASTITCTSLCHHHTHHATKEHKLQFPSCTHTKISVPGVLNEHRCAQSSSRHVHVHIWSSLPSIYISDCFIAYDLSLVFWIIPCYWIWPWISLALCLTWAV